MSYDEKCYDLGALFLLDEAQDCPELNTEQNRDLLAQEIQDVIEWFIEAHRPATCLTCGTITITCRPCTYCKEPVCDQCEAPHLTSHHKWEAQLASRRHI